MKEIYSNPNRNIWIREVYFCDDLWNELDINNLNDRESFHYFDAYRKYNLIVEFEWDREKSFLPLDYPGIVVSERLKDYFMEKCKSKDISFKEVKLRDKETKEIRPEKYYYMIPNKVYLFEERDQIKDLGYALSEYTENDLNFPRIGNSIKRYSLANLYATDEIYEELKKTKFKGFWFPKPPYKVPAAKWYKNDSNKAYERLNGWLNELTKEKVLKSKQKYLYYTITEEEKGYNIGVGGYDNQYFDEITMVYQPDYCELVGTELDEMEWEEALHYLQELLVKVYDNYQDSDICKIKARIGFHDGDILKIK